MANVIINRSAGTASKDGVSQTIDVSELDANITTIEYNTLTRVGKITYNDASQKYIGAVGFRPFNIFVRRWDAVTNPETVTAEEALERAKAQIDVTREAALDAGVTWNGTLWYADPIFQTQLTSFVAAYNTGIIGPLESVNIRGKDGSNNSLNAAQVGTLAATVMAYVQTVYATSWAAKDAL